MPGQAAGIPPRTRWLGSPAYMKMKKKKIEFALLNNFSTKAEAEKYRKGYKRQGIRYTRIKKSRYGGYDLLIGVRPLGPDGIGGGHPIMKEGW